MSVMPEPNSIPAEPSENLHIVVVAGDGETAEVAERAVAEEPSYSPKISILGDVELRVDVVLGRARRTLADLLSVRPGQTIELDRQRNSPVEVLVHNKPFALGEIVVIDETNLGVRVLEILDWAMNSPGRPA